MSYLDMQNLRIAIYGAGAMGTVLGAFLISGGLKNVDLVTRNEKHVTAMRESGARVICEADNKEINVKVNALIPAEMQGEYDVIFLMTKQRHNAEIATKLLPYLKTDGVICTAQNGLPEQSIATITGAERTYGAVMSYGADFMEKGGKVKLTSKLSAMHVEIGGYHNNGEKLPLLKEILSYAINQTNENFVAVTDDLLGARWAKLSINAAFSGLSVMTGLSFGEIARKNKTRKLALCVLRECIAVAKAQGITLAKMHGHDMEKMLGEKTPLKCFIAYMVLPFAMKKHKKLHSGMLRDIDSGRKCEIDFINGVVCEEGKKVGVETPVCEQIVEIVHGIENGLYETDYKNVDFFV